MILFKIKSGYYYNLTYSTNDQIDFDPKLLLTSDIELIRDLEGKINYKSMIDIEDILINENKIQGYFVSNSRVDKCPVFKIDLEKEIRDNKIKNIINEK